MDDPMKFVQVVLENLTWCVECGGSGTHHPGKFDSDDERCGVPCTSYSHTCAGGCQGTGKKQRTCPECHGDKRVMVYESVPGGMNASNPRCSTCEGSGTVAWDEAYALEELLRIANSARDYVIANDQARALLAGSQGSISTWEVKSGG